MAGNNIVQLTHENFDDEVSAGIVLIDMWAPWCGPCQMQGPILENVAVTVGDKAKIAKLNVDECQSSAARFGVQSIPTLILFKDGNELRRFIGVQREAVLVSAINDASKA